MARKEHFVQEAFPGMLKGSALGIVSKGRRVKKDTETPPVEQLVMYKTPTEIMGEYDPLEGDMELGETPKNTWDRKAKESLTGFSGNSRNLAFHQSHPDTLANSIKRDGVQNPVTLEPRNLDDIQDRPQVFGGHHRIAIASKINPNMLIPVSYSDTLRHASTYTRKQGHDPRFPVE